MLPITDHHWGGCPTDFETVLAASNGIVVVVLVVVIMIFVIIIIIITLDIDVLRSDDGVVVQTENGGTR